MGITGVAQIGGEQVELIDVHALFAGELAPAAQRPLCLLRCDGTGWMDTFLRPVLEAAGYRCASRLGEGERPAVTLAMAEDGAPANADAASLVMLSRQPGQAGIYRYDRAALIAAVAERARGRA
jgi:two-component system chemotaxis sensor kinase CheA